MNSEISEASFSAKLQKMESNLNIEKSDFQASPVHESTSRASFCSGECFVFIVELACKDLEEYRIASGLVGPC